MHSFLLFLLKVFTMVFAEQTSYQQIILFKIFKPRQNNSHDFSPLLSKIKKNEVQSIRIFCLPAV